MDILRLSICFKTDNIKDLNCHIEFLSINNKNNAPNDMIINENNRITMYYPMRTKWMFVDESKYKLQQILLKEKDLELKINEIHKILPSYHMAMSISLFGKEEYKYNNINKNIIIDKQDI
eukprot:212893_1